MAAHTPSASQHDHKRFHGSLHAGDRYSGSTRLGVPSRYNLTLFSSHCSSRHRESRGKEEGRRVMDSMHWRTVWAMCSQARAHGIAPMAQAQVMNVLDLNLLCFVLFYSVLFCFISFHIISYHIMSCHIISCHVISCHVMSCHIMSYHVMSCHVMSCHFNLS